MKDERREHPAGDQEPGDGKGLGCDMEASFPCRETGRVALRGLADSLQRRGEDFIGRASGLRILVDSLTADQCEAGKIEEAIHMLVHMTRGNPRMDW